MEWEASTTCTYNFGATTQHAPAHFLYVSVSAGVRPQVYIFIGALAAVCLWLGEEYTAMTPITNPG